jgi:hypothetical protein
VTYPAVRLPTQTQSDRRRPGIFPGRRFALATAVACAAVAGGAGLPATAAADQPVVSATIFPGTSGNPSTQSVLLSTLASSPCQIYDGPSWTFSDGQGPLTTAAVWSLGEVISCGLSIAPENVMAVQVFNNDNNSYENSLTPAGGVFDPSTYPSGALPLISVDGTTTSGGPVTYTRPPSGPSDQAQSDQFTEDGTTPISIDVYESRPPLQITAAPVYGAATASSRTVTLAATVTDADGAAVAPSQLTWSWTLAGSSVGSEAAPTVTIAAGDSQVATVLVTDPATGTGGTATFDVSYSPTPSPPSATQPTGAGANHQGGPTGQKHGKQDANGPPRKVNDGGGLDHAGTNRGTRTIRSPRHPGSTPGSSSPPARGTAQTTTTTTTTTTSPAPPAAPTTVQTTTVTAPPHTPTPTSTPALTVDTAPAKAPPHRRIQVPQRRSVAQPGASARLVTGRLVADVQALPERDSPLVRPVAASAAAPSLVHAAGDGTSAPTWAYAALAVLLLLGGGALYERHGHHGRTLHR